ncbi:RidA family protein [Rhodococcus opacus]|uniref:RidA family protein n=1 Tax=Rhodococcus opacus TaxID=37919 RepID=UPI001C474A39|nr:RidA family protein [Rhodococcus opacus]MBV6761653.1 RidA family protein [Rhodococcus opacus]
MTAFIHSQPSTDQLPRRSAGVAAGDFVFATGNALDPSTGRRATTAQTITDEVRLCFAAIDDVLREAGLTRSHLVKTTCWVTDEAHRPEFIEAYRAECAVGVYPARVTMEAGLPGQCRIAIEAVACGSTPRGENC